MHALGFRAPILGWALRRVRFGWHFRGSVRLGFASFCSGMQRGHVYLAPRCDRGIIFA